MKKSISNAWLSGQRITEVPATGEGSQAEGAGASGCLSRADYAKYQQRVKALKVPGYQEAEQAYSRKSPSRTQNAILLSQRSRKSLLLALGRNAELRQATGRSYQPRSNWSSAGTYRIEGQNHAKSKNQRQPQPRQFKGSNGAVINNLDKLKAKALETVTGRRISAAKKAKNNLSEH